MDMLGKLVQGTGCSVDGTVAAQNPLSKALDNLLQSQGRSHAPMQARGPPSHMAMQMQRNNFARTADAQMMQNFEEQAMHRAHMEAAFRDGKPSAQQMMQRQHSMETAYGEAQRLQQYQRQQHMQPLQHHHPPPAAASMQEAWVSGFKSMHLDDAWVNGGSGAVASQPQPWHGPRDPRLLRPMHQPMMMHTPHHPHFAAQESQEASEKVEEGARRTATQEASSEVARTMAANPDAKFQNSEFLRFMNDVSDGKVEIDEEKNRVVGANGVLDDDVRVNRDLYQVWHESEDNVKSASTSRKMEGVWDEAGKMKVEEELDLEAMWEKAMAEAQGTDPFEDVWEDVTQANVYVPKAENPYADLPAAFEQGIAFFNAGHLNDAILAFESEIQQHPENSEAWRLLGECHAENDEDKSAIICLERAVEEDPYNLSALLALGVSHVNELNSQGALRTLKAWVQHNPKFHGFEIQVDEYSDGSLMDEVMQLMLQARAHDPADSDVHVVLGVLYNVSKDYDAAVTSFHSAVHERPAEYSLWNKLGATLANSSRSSEAIPAYHKALEIKPRYARGWLNLGISHANLGNYQEATKCYLQALSLNDRADHIWSYLRICFTCMERFDLVKLADTRNVDLFQAEFPYLDLK